MNQVPSREPGAAKAGGWGAALRGDASGRPVPNGIYFVRVSGRGAVVTEKILLMR